MKIDTERIEQYLLEIKSRHHEIEELFRTHTDAEILKAPWVLKGIKYTLVEIAEAMANILQHILSKHLGHRYWYISDEKLLSLVRENQDDFLTFIEAIEKYLRKN
jgi:uncharacterized protein YutE (UPF0331/DUF86 family)